MDDMNGSPPEIGGADERGRGAGDAWAAVNTAFEQARAAGTPPPVGQLLAQYPQEAAEILRLASFGGEAEARGQGAEGADSDSDGAQLATTAERAFAAALTPPVDGLADLRLEADLTIDELAEELGIPEQAALRLEEEPVLDAPRPFLRLLGRVLGYTINQVSALVSAPPRVAHGAAFLVEGGGRPRGKAGGGAPITFAQLLEETGATADQKERWLSSDSGSADDE